MWILSRLLEGVPGLLHGFGTAEMPLPSFVQGIWDTQRPNWKQVHGVRGVEVTVPGQECGETDALYTRKPNLPIGVLTADCVPLLLSHKSGKVGAAVHAGWRGTRGRILYHLWEQLKAEGEKPQDWVAAIGPSIGPCCYQVSEELAQDFKQAFQEYGEKTAVPFDRILDLPAINAMELKKIGISEVDLIRVCTFCSSQLGQAGQSGKRFHSFRRDGSKERQRSVLVLNPSGS